MHQSRNALTGKIGNAILSIGIRKGITTFFITEAEVHMQPAAAPVRKGLGHKTQQIPALGQYLLGHHLEQKNVVNSGQGIRVSECQFKLRPFVF